MDLLGELVGPPGIDIVAGNVPEITGNAYILQHRFSRDKRPDGVEVGDPVAGDDTLDHVEQLAVQRRMKVILGNDFHHVAVMVIVVEDCTQQRLLKTCVLGNGIRVNQRAVLPCGFPLDHAHFHALYPFITKRETMFNDQGFSYKLYN